LLESHHSGEGKKTTSRFDLPGRPLSVRYDLSTDRKQQAVVALAHSRLKSAARGFLRACHPEIATIDGPKRNLWVAHWKGWLSPVELAEFNRHLKLLVNMLRRGAHAKGPRRTAHEFTFALAPVVPADLAARNQRLRKKARTRRR
jgi:hypothetical protein